MLGRVLEVPVAPKLTVVNIFSQLYYGRDGQRYTDYGAIKMAFEQFIFNRDQEIGWSKFDDSLCYFPMRMGCTLGGGNWSVVYKLIRMYFPNSTICNYG